MKNTVDKLEGDAFVRAMARGLRRAAKEARKVARAHGTPVYVWKNGKVVALKA